ncbi:MAG: hypothetical protein IJM77_04960 [Spirochaetia bacterium]|nr:hypothetical protein [Spirochaetia bacterium]
MTFHELVKALYARGCNLADVAVGRMMDEIEEETGIWPDWDETAPDWVLANAGISKRSLGL